MSLLKRLDAILANCGYGSRRNVIKMITSGRVTWNDTIVYNPAQKVDPFTVSIDDELIDHPGPLFLAMHKPLGVVCSHDSSEGMRIYDMLPLRWQMRNPQLTSIGRLDKDTSGIILITDALSLVHEYTSPKKSIEKIYEVTVDKELIPTITQVFLSGSLMLHGEKKPCLPAAMEQTGLHSCRITITEGRYHQVRRMFASQGYAVTKLHRISFGEFTLDGIEAGEYRECEVPGI